MKTKIKKSKGYYRLVVDDEEINKKYGFKESIVLGCITEFWDAKQWRVEDYRLKEHLMPSPYLEDGVQVFKPRNEKEKQLLMDSLHTYKISEDGTFSWDRFNATRFEGGDLPCLTDKTLKQYSPVARFTFKKAYQLLLEQKEFWDNYDKKDLCFDEIRIENPHRQISESEILFKFLMGNIDKGGSKKAKPKAKP